MLRFYQCFRLVIFQQFTEQVKRLDIMKLAFEAVALEFGDNFHSRISADGGYIIYPMVSTDFHWTAFLPQVIINESYSSQSGNGFKFAVGGNPALCHFVNGIFGRLSDLVISLYKEETYHLIAFADRNNGEIFIFPEYSLSGGVYFQFHSAMRAGATAKRICQCSVSLPLVFALGAGNDAFGRPAPDVFKTMMESIRLLRFANLR